MITKYHESHTPQILDIWQEANIQAHSFIPAEYWLENRQVVETQYLPNAETFIYEEEEQVKAFISIVEGSFIGALFVTVDCQSQGIGKRLIDYCQKMYPHLELAVYKENTRAFDFYRRCRFRIQEERNNSDSGHPEYLMVWP